MNDKNGKRILQGDLVKLPGENFPREVYGGNYDGSELWYWDHVAGRFEGIDPALVEKVL